MKVASDKTTAKLHPEKILSFFPLFLLIVCTSEGSEREKNFRFFFLFFLFFFSKKDFANAEVSLNYQFKTAHKICLCKSQRRADYSPHSLTTSLFG
jgi:hypothetical protein